VAGAARRGGGAPDSGLAPYRALVEQGHVDVLQPDLARCGGFTVARGIARLAAEHDVEAVPHCFSTGVLVAASLHFVAALARPTWSEYSVADSPFVNGVLAEPFVLRDGALRVPTGPGLGVELDDELIERIRVH
jgi:L-alanine-DL-glutamate epimerase-like enolase superfamily enzyme